MNCPNQHAVYPHIINSFLVFLWFTYEICTFFCPGYQTLGEEYANIIQVDPTKRTVPSGARRGLFVFCQIFFPYFLDKVLMCLENELEGGQESSSTRRQAAPGLWSLESWLRRWTRKAVGLLSETQRKTCLPAVFVLQQSLTLLHRLHVALFYISGSFYHLSKRAAGISYVGETHFSYISFIYLVLESIWSMYLHHLFPAKGIWCEMADKNTEL